MRDESTVENSGEVELYAELGPLPKVGGKVRLSRRTRVDRVLDSAANYAELEPGQLEDRLADADDRVRDVVVTAAVRAQQVDDAEYLDVLGRLIAGALDPAKVDEVAYLTSEITKLEPVHIRALLGLFLFAQSGDEAFDLDLGPADATKAAGRARPEREIAILLDISQEATSQVLLRLERDGYVEWDNGVKNGRRPTEWACRALALMFPLLEVEFEDVSTRDESADGATQLPPGDSAGTIASLAESVSHLPSDPEKEHRAIRELEAEIKKAEKARLSPISNDLTGVEQRWLDLLKRRLRQVDPNNPWAARY